MRKVFVLNCGSASIKYKLFDADSGYAVLSEGIIERIEAGSEAYQAAFGTIFGRLHAEGVLEDPNELYAAGHRVVHGGEAFVAPVRIDADVIAEIERLIPLAPLHNPANLEGIKMLQNAAPDLFQAAVFDTAFHQSMPPEAYRYAIEERLYREQGIRRFGFHGISHAYLTRRSCALLGKTPEHCNLITLHLGGGASATAVCGGRSIDTSMGFTPLEGLVMGTRCGDLDPGAVLYLIQEAGVTPQALGQSLEHESGLKGVCGSADMRDILKRRAEGDTEAALAFSLFCRRIQKYIGAYIALLGRVDAIVFSGGVGANASEVRAEVCANLSHLGIVCDPEKNSAACRDAVMFASDESRIALIAMQTDEELEIARQTTQLREESS